jgi:hypothetical protein
MSFKSIYTAAFITLPLLSAGQAMDNYHVYQNMEPKSYYRLNYDNDFFTATDEYYTQGISMEVLSPTLKYNPLAWLTIHLRNADNRYGVMIEHEGYTPRSIGDEQILYNNHPYAGVLMLRTFSTSTQVDKGQRLYTSSSLGVIGPTSGAKEMQMSIHKALGNLLPGGWKNQIRNDIVLNYEAQYEHLLCNGGHIFELDGNAGGRIGTLSDKANIGMELMAGYFNSPLRDNNDGRAFHFYLFEAPSVSGVVYDATLQGGIFDHDSPYTISALQMSRFVFDNRAGAALTYKGIYIQYYYAYQSKIFKTGLTHWWGGFSVGTRL